MEPSAGDEGTGADSGETADPGRLADLSLTIVSNREPYVHEYDGEEVVGSTPTGGLVSALGDVVAETGGTWVAWGSGDADFDPEVAPDGVVDLPPDDPAYTLRRLDLSRGAVDGYYYGYANQVLWPLCHLDTNYVHVDPEFFPAYERVNRRFAEAVCETDPDVVWFQDYHLALAPRAVRESLPDVRLVHFWHIPWPGPEVFGICPQAQVLLRGLLANDALGFHLSRYAENFLDCVEAELPDATVDRTAGMVGLDGHVTTVYDSPIGVDVDHVAASARSEHADRFFHRLLDRHDVDPDTQVAVGVDRLDYTKGLVERLAALDHLWATRPDLRGEFTFVQKAARSRERIPSYRAYHARVRDRIYELNRVHGTDDWTPVVYVEEAVENCELAGLYRHADLAVVSPRRDGMNLVAKEYVAASQDTAGVLVLSQFAGVAESLGDAALSVNPYDVGGFADTIERAVRMEPGERRDRMARLQAAVRQQDLDAWLADQVAVLAGRDGVPSAGEPAGRPLHGEGP